jgi:hypothetical protein
MQVSIIALAFAMALAALAPRITAREVFLHSPINKAQADKSAHRS